MKFNGLPQKLIITLSLLILTLPLTAFSRHKIVDDDWKEDYSYAAASPEFCIVAHNVGKIVLGVNNNGTFGDGFAAGSTSDCFTGEIVPSCVYPKGTASQYLFAGAFWIGAVVGRDTLVSVGADGWQLTREFFPNEAPFGKPIYRSIIDPDKPEYEGAISEQDYIMTYTDTFTSGVPGLDNDYLDGRPHRPLNIEVTQRTYAWSYPYAEDFVLFDYSIKNIGRRTLENVYMGIYVDGDVMQRGADQGFDDDICGFLFSYPNEYKCKSKQNACICDSVWEDTVFIAWIADNDGEFNTGPMSTTTLENVTATRIIRTPSENPLDVSFNWWVSNGANPLLDFGPRKKSANFRDLGTGGMGTPEGDRNKYAFLRNREFDYDQVFTAAITATDSIWMLPPQTLAHNLADGFDTRYLLSFGFFNIDPGQSLPISFAYVGGMPFHIDPNNFDNNLANDYNPKEFYNNLSFADLALNSMWASWVYDNPGVDSDDNNEFGQNRICYKDIETLDTCCEAWYKGDGVPDFRGAQPPPAPKILVGPDLTEGSVGTIKITWNGYLSETTEDAFSKEFDFEGYRVYLARDDRPSSFSMLTSYDVEDYNIYIFVPSLNEWDLTGIPLPIDSLRARYGSSATDTTFNPAIYTRNNPLIVSSSEVLYFEPQDFNRSILANEPNATTEIRKVYYDEIKNGTLLPPTVDNVNDADPSEVTDHGTFKYYEYEFTVTGLLPTVPYFINVTAFDFGSPESGLGALETAVTLNSVEVYPNASASDVAEQKLPVYIYPNPYRIDGGYAANGFEGRNAEYDIPDRLRRINFANLPAKCKIRIYSLDGDLIRELEHDMDPNDPRASHDTWDLITRNTQLVVTGIYYWVVEDENGETQIGKLVIMM